MLLSRCLGALFFHLTASLALAASSPVEIIITPAEIVRRTFDPRRSPPEMPPLRPPEVGQCVYEFGCEAETRIELPPVFPGRSAYARITATRFTTRLSVTLWVPQNGPAQINEHEEGHREICEFYYRSAENVARRLASELIGRRLPLRTRDHALAQNALREEQNRAIHHYLRETLQRCSYAQERFDAITRHSLARVPVDAAVAQAIADEQTHYATNTRVPESTAPATSRLRAPPTRPRT